MILPFVRELLADAEATSSFRRAATHLKGGTGRIRVSGLTPTARALHYALLHRALGRPLLLVVGDNRTAEELLPLLQSLCEMTGAASPDSVAFLPALDVLPFENLSPHPEIQELRARALWRIASGTASLVVAPFAATAIRLRDAAYYRDLARVVRKGEWLELEKLVQHLNIVGYRQTDVVEQQGEYARRGGILDVYSPEMERPVRMELFGDEVESLRLFDPVTQRSAAGLEEAVLLPLTETPVTAELLAAIHARLSGKRVSGSEEALAEAARAGGVSVFPGWEFFAPVYVENGAGAANTVFDLMPDAAVVLDEPERLGRRSRQLVAAAHRCARAQRRRQPGASRGAVRHAGCVARARRHHLRRWMWSSSDWNRAMAPNWCSSARSPRRASTARCPSCWRK